MEFRDMFLQICVLLCTFGYFDAVPYRLFFPFGEGRGDSILDAGDDISSTEIQLSTPIVFYNNRYSGIFINNNGHLSFETDLPTFQSNLVLPIGYKVIAAFLADIDTTYAGTVYYRESTEEALLQKAALDIQAHFDEHKTFMPTSVFIATWDRVGFYNANDTKLNTFQIVLATDGSNSFAFFHYLDDGIQWIKSEGKQNYPDPLAQAGFDSGEGRIHTKLPYSGTERAFELAKETNLNNDDMAGVWMYQIGYVQEVVGPELNTVIIFDPDEDSNTCVAGSKQCHVSARCIDYDSGFCCQCIPPTYGNGINCIQQGPQRLNGKVSGNLNGVDIQNIDMHSYVVTSDGRAYTAISRIGPDVGPSMLTLNTIGGIIGWMFASVITPRARNGYMYTGALFNRTAVIKYQASGDEVTIRQVFYGHDAQNNIRLSTQVNGKVPKVENGVKVSLEDYREEYRRVAPGLITAYSVRTYRLNDVAYRYTWNQTIRFTECRHNPSPVSDTMRLSVNRNFVVYDDLDEVIRYAMTNKIGIMSGTDPCRDAAQVCGDYADCIPNNNTYTCRCKAGFHGDGNTCKDINECTDVRDICDRNARCYNVPGSFQCQCMPGYKGDGRVCTKDVQRCGEDVCHERARCVYNSDLQRPMCECRSGFTGDGVNTCNPVQFTCNEVDICHEDASCIYDSDSEAYKCECNEGYSGDGVVCEQYNIETECRCNENAQCIFDPARLIRRCQCNIGYTGDGTYCSPIANPAVCDDCHSNARCAMDARANQYYCECLPGFTGNGYRCEAAAEDCRTRQMCDPNADCVNDPFVGAYRCLCKNGFTGNGLQCEPDHCSSDGDCDVNARCVIDPRDNTRYTCRCLAGYVEDGRGCRQRVIPCNQENNCSPYAECIYNPTELSYRCRCKPGYEGDGYSCRPRGYDCRRDSRICDPNANCILNVDSFICVCKEGFRGDGRRCIAMDVENNYLMFSQGYSIHKIPFIAKEDDPGQRILYVPDQLVVAIDSDCEDQDFYWTDVSGGTINKAKLDGSEQTTVISDLRSPEGIAVDWLSRNLYWTDSGWGTIEVAKLDGSYRKNLFGSELVNPRAIVLDPSSGMMYWTDWNRNSPKIESAHMDGENRKVLVDTDLGLPNGLTINTHTQQVCWGDAGTRKIECIRSDGVGRRVVTSDAPYPFDLAYLSDSLYWTDWQVTGISNINQNGGDKGEPLSLPMGGNGRLYGITAVRGTCPRAGYNPCATDNGGCQFLCLPAPSGGRTCICPDNVDPNECNEVA